MRDDRARLVADLAIRHASEMSALLESGDGAARQAYKKLATWVPEYLPEEVMTSYKENGAKKGEVPPFFSEVTLYELLGKEEARTLLAMMSKLGRALGFDSRRDLIEEAESESKGVDPSAPMTHDDLDALEGFMREDASYRFYRSGDDAANIIIRIMKVMPLLRSLVGEPQPDIEWKRIYPKDLRVGDRIIQNGRIITVFGFLDERHKPCDGPTPWGDELASYERPTDARKTPCLEYACNVKTHAEDQWGWRLKSNEELVIQRALEGK